MILSDRGLQIPLWSWAVLLFSVLFLISIILHVATRLSLLKHTHTHTHTSWFPYWRGGSLTSWLHLTPLFPRVRVSWGPCCMCTFKGSGSAQMLLPPWRHSSVISVPVDPFLLRSQLPANQYNSVTPSVGCIPDSVPRGPRSLTSSSQPAFSSRCHSVIELCSMQSSGVLLLHPLFPLCAVLSPFFPWTLQDVRRGWRLAEV